MHPGAPSRVAVRPTADTEPRCKRCPSGPGSIDDTIRPDRRDRSESTCGATKKMLATRRSGAMSGDRRVAHKQLNWITISATRIPRHGWLRPPPGHGERHHKHTSRVHVQVVIAGVVEPRAPCPRLDPENVPRTAKSRPSARGIEAASAVPAGGAGCSWGREQISLRPGGGHVLWPLYKSQIAGAERAGIPFGELNEVECGQVLRA